MRSHRDAILSNLSRHPGDQVEVFEGVDWLLAKVDIGAFGASASVYMPEGSTLIIAGEPLPIEEGAARHANRQSEALQIFESLENASEAALRKSTGTFCGAFFSSGSHSLTLFADPLSVRPIYYRITPEVVVFASALRILEASGFCHGEVDLRGACETATFGFPLADRTGYADVRTIQPAEIIRVSQDAETHSRYLNWSRLEDMHLDGDKLVQELATAFRDAVRRRLRGDQVVLSFLSGGLDSRAIVGELRDQKTTVLSVNFAPPDTQDRVFGALAAEAIGTFHHQIDVPLSASTNVYRKEYLRHWIDATSAQGLRPDRPFCIWSGDGGSVALGHVYLDAHAVDALERGDVDSAVKAFVAYNRIAGASNSAMTSAFRSRTAAWHVEGIRNEIKALEGSRNGRAGHLFLMFNDQRRHLADHFENIDIQRFEFHLPFFDRRFLEIVLAAPVRPFLRHALYYRWLEALNPVAVSVPWQAYPNHEPCPVPYDAQLRYQWRDYWAASEDRRIARNRAARAAKYLFSAAFPDRYLNRGRFAAALLLSMVGVTSVGHVVNVGATFARLFDTASARGKSGRLAAAMPVSPQPSSPGRK